MLSVRLALCNVHAERERRRRRPFPCVMRECVLRKAMVWHFPPPPQFSLFGTLQQRKTVPVFFLQTLSEVGSVGGGGGLIPRHKPSNSLGGREDDCDHRRTAWPPSPTPPIGTPLARSYISLVCSPSEKPKRVAMCFFVCLHDERKESSEWGGPAPVAVSSSTRADRSNNPRGWHGNMEAFIKKWIDEGL